MFAVTSKVALVEPEAIVTVPDRDTRSLEPAAVAAPPKSLPPTLYVRVTSDEGADDESYSICN